MWTTVITAALVAAVLAQESGRAVPSIGELQAQASQRYIPASLRIAYDVYQEPADGLTGGHIPHVFQDVLVDTTTGRFSIERFVEAKLPRGDSLPSHVTLSFDGDVQAAFLPEEMIGVVSESGNVNGLAEAGLVGVMLLGQPQPDGLGIDDASLVSYLANGTVRDQVELVGDVPCLVIDAFHEGVRYATLWLDGSRDLLPMKRVTYGRDGEVTVIVSVDSVTYLEDADIWIPRRWHTDMRLAGRLLRSRVEVVPESVEIDPPISEEEFQAQFPPGTVVADQVQGLVYRIDEAGEPGEVLYENIDGEWVSVASAEPDSPTRPDGIVEANDALVRQSSRNRRARSIFEELLSVTRLLASHREQVGNQTSRPAKTAEPEHGGKAAEPLNGLEAPADTATSTLRDSRPSKTADRRAVATSQPATATVTGRQRPGWRLWLLAAGALLTVLVQGGLNYARRRRKPDWSEKT